MPAPDYSVEIATLETALAKNERVIMQNGERVEYNSVSEMIAALRYFKQQAANNAASGFTTLAAFNG